MTDQSHQFNANWRDAAHPYLDHFYRRSLSVSTVVCHPGPNSWHRFPYDFMFPLNLKMIEITAGRAIKTLPGISPTQRWFNDGYLSLRSCCPAFLKTLKCWPEQTMQVVCSSQSFFQFSQQSQCFPLQFKPTPSQWGPLGHEKQMSSSPLVVLLQTSSLPPFLCYSQQSSPLSWGLF